MLQTTYSIVNFVTKRNIDFAIDSKTKDAFEKVVATKEEILLRAKRNISKSSLQIFDTDNINKTL